MKKSRFFVLLLMLVIMVTYMPVMAYAEPETAKQNSQSVESLAGNDTDWSGNCMPDGTFDIVTLDDVAKGQPVAALPGSRRSGTKQANLTQMPLLIIVIGFKDTPYNNDYDWGATIFSAAREDMSLSRYYSDNSQGKFTFAPALETSAFDNDKNTNKKDAVNDGIVHVSVDMDHDNWVSQWKSDEDIDGHLSTWANALGAAMNEADKYVDFAQYDADGDGEIETNEIAVGFVIAGGEASYNENRYSTDNKYLSWAHAWEMSSFMDNAPVCDGKKVDKYIAIAEDLIYFRYFDHEQAESLSESYFTNFEELGPDTEGISLNDIKVLSTGKGDFRFQPAESGWYAFFSEKHEEDDAMDPVARILDSEGTPIAYGDDESNGCHFESWFYCEAGGTYYLQASNYDNGAVYSAGVISIDEPKETIESEQAGIGTLAHELGHYLGLPDYYNTDDNDSGPWGNYAVYRMSIMAGGNWCYTYDEETERSNYLPCAFDACSRVALGWVDPVLAEPGNEYVVTAQDYSNNTGYNILKIPTENEKEYFLVENRQFAGWDEGLRTSYPEKDITEEDEDEGLFIEQSGCYAETGGLVIWHVDDGIVDRYKEDNEINTSGHRPGYMPVFMEYDNYPEFRFIGSKVDIIKLFFDEPIYNGHYAATAGETILLPVYNAANDIPAARGYLSNAKGIKLEGTGANIKVKYGDAHDHKLILTDETKAGCETNGNKKYWTCSICGRFFGDEKGTTEIADGSWVIPATGHDFGNEYTIDKKATCTEEGSESIHCSRCNAVKEGSSRPIAKTAHNYGGWNVTKEPTVNEAGIRQRSCSVCGVTETEVIEKLPSDKPADAEQAGTGEKETQPSVTVGDSVNDSNNAFTVTSVDAMSVAFTKAGNRKSVTVPATININGKAYKVTQINANAFKGSKIRTVTIGKNVKVIKKNAFKGSPAAKVILKTKLLKKAKVKGSLKGSKVKTVQIKVGKKAENKKYVKTYKKIFTKANAGKKVAVK